MALDQETRQNLMNSPGGVKLANLELLNLFSIVEKLGIKADDVGDGGNISIKGRTCLLERKKHTIELTWEAKYKNTLEESVLYLRLWRGYITKKGNVLGLLRKPKLVKQRVFSFELNAAGGCEWLEQGFDKIINSEDLAHLAVSTLDQAG